MKYIFKIGLVIGIVLIAIGVDSRDKADLAKPSESSTTKKVKFDTPKFTKYTLKKELVKRNIKHDSIVFAQARLETGNFKSYLFKKHNNLFGFRGKKGYIEYNHWTESVAAYKRFQDKYYKGGDYYTFLEDRGYAEDPDYINKVRSCVN